MLPKKTVLSSFLVFVLCGAATVSATFLAGDDVVSVPCGATSVLIPNSDLVANDIHPFGSPLIPCLTGIPDRGRLDLHVGAFRYHPAPAFWVYGEDRFTYRVTDGPYCPGTSNQAVVWLRADCVRSSVFEDSFESDDLSAWDGQWNPDGATFEVTGDAALSGVPGLRIGVPPGSTFGMLVKDIPPVRERLHAAFLMNPSQLTLAEGYSIALLAGLEGHNGNFTFQLRMRPRNGEVQIKIDTWDDAFAWNSMQGWATIDPTKTSAIHVEWWTAEAPGSADGGVVLRLDGEIVGQISGLDNSTRFVSRFRFGALGIDPGTSGSLDFDAFRSWVEPRAD